MMSLRESIRRLYHLSGLTFPFHKLLKIMSISMVSTAVATTALLYALVFSQAYGPIGLVPSALLGFALGGAVGVGILTYPMYLIRRRRFHFDNRFVYTLAFMVPLLSSGMPLPRVTRLVAELEPNKVISREFKLILRDVAVGGVDMMAALEASMQRSPSDIYKDVVNVIVTGGRVTTDLGSLLVPKLDWLVRNKTIRLIGLVNSLSLMFEAYVIMTMLLPIVGFVMAVSLSPLGGITFAGLSLSPTDMMVLFSFVLSPLMGLVFYLLFDSIASEI